MCRPRRWGCVVGFVARALFLGPLRGRWPPPGGRHPPPPPNRGPSRSSGVPITVPTSRWNPASSSGPRSFTCRSSEKLGEEWEKTNMLVALIAGNPVAYLRMTDQLVPGTVWITDLVVGRAERRKGIGSSLVIAAHAWATQMGNRRAVLEMQSKNSAAVRLAQKLGYEFCGYNDQYYATRDVALFFGRLL